MKPHTLVLPLALSLTLSGCVVGTVADLAATTVVTAGKLVVKGTGAVIDAAIPDKDDDKKDKKSKKKNSGSEAESTAAPAAAYRQPVYANPPATQTRYITIDEYGNSYETVRPEPSAQ